MNDQQPVTRAENLLSPLLWFISNLLQTIWTASEVKLICSELSQSFKNWNHYFEVSSSDESVISILIFTFYIISYISIIIKHQTGLVFWIFRINSYLREVLEEPRGGTPMLNVIAIRDQRYANVSKPRTNVAGWRWHCSAARRAIDHMTGKCFSSRNELQQECEFHVSS